MVSAEHDSSSSGLTTPIVTDFVPTDDIRSALTALGVDPDDDNFEFSDGAQPGYVWTIRVYTPLLDEQSETPDGYTQVYVGGTEGDLEAAFGEALEELRSVDAFKVNSGAVEYQLGGSADEFTMAMAE